MKYLIVGLGNIGEEYETTRHNIGFKISDNITEIIGSKFELKKHAFYAKGKFKGSYNKPNTTATDSQSRGCGWRSIILSIGLEQVYNRTNYLRRWWFSNEMILKCRFFLIFNKIILIPSKQVVKV